MKRLLWYASCCWTLSLIGAATAQASPQEKASEQSTTATAASLGRLASSENQFTTTKISEGAIAQVPPPPPAPEVPGGAPAAPGTPTSPNSTENQEIQRELNTIQENKPTTAETPRYQPQTSPAFSIFNPVGFGADRNLLFISGDYQSTTRSSTGGSNSGIADGELGIGVGLGDATKAVGVEISYGINSFGSSSSFGSGAFSAKLHRRIADDTSVAIGWNQFAQVTFGRGGTDYPKNSYYAAATKIFRTTDDINAPFSRVAVTGGVGRGVFLPFDRFSNPNDDRPGVGVFGSLGVRVARPVSAIVEWTGQDLAAGVSIAPFDNFPLVITPAFRDITGIAGGSARFILGASVAFNF